MAKPTPLSVNREVFADAVERISSACRPKAKDAEFRRMLFVERCGNDAVSLCATNETTTIIFRDIKCATGTFQTCAADLTKITKFARGSKDDTVRLSMNPKGSMLMVASGKRKRAEIDYMDGDAYEQYVDNPTDVPDDDMFTKVKGMDTFRVMSQIVLSCADPKQRHLNGIWTNGDGKFIATDTFRAMFQNTEHKFGFRTVLPADLFAVLKLIPGDVLYFYWSDGALWIKDVDSSMYACVYTVEDSNFPHSEIQDAREAVFEEAECSITIDAAEFNTALKAIHGFFGESVVCRLNFKGKRLVITGESDSTSNRIQEVISYELTEGDVDGMSIRFDYSSLAVLTDLYDESFELRLTDGESPACSESEELGTQVMLLPREDIKE